MDIPYCLLCCPNLSSLEANAAHPFAAKASSALDPLASSSAPPPPPANTGSLNFASSSSTKAAPKAEPGATESWDDVIQRAKADAVVKALSAEEAREEEKRRKEKEEKRKRREKKDAKKKVGLLSFDDE